MSFFRANRGESVRLRGRRHGGIAKLRVDWGRAINVGEAAAREGAAARTGCRKSWSAFSVGRAVFLVRSILLIKKYFKCYIYIILQRPT